MSLLVVPKACQELLSTSCPDCTHKIANGNDYHNLFVQEKGQTKKAACDDPVEDGSSQSRAQKHHLVNVVRPARCLALSSWSV